MASRLSRYLLALCAVAGMVTPAFAGSYQGVASIPYLGAQSDRGISVNKNPASPYYGYFYATDSGGSFTGGPAGTGVQAVRIYAPVSGGTQATAYTNTNNLVKYAANPPGAVLVNCFVGSDDTVWVVDFGARNICTGPPNGGDVTVQFQPVNKPRAVYVDGALGADGTRVYVAAFENTANSSCEVWEYDLDTTSWNLVSNLGNLGIRPFGVTMDDQGNTYWASNSASAPFVRKVDSNLVLDASWAITKPSFLGTGWTVGDAEFVSDPNDPVNSKYLYVSAFNQTGVVRFDMNGAFLDGFGSTFGMAGTPPAGTWTTIAFSGTGGNNQIFVATDDQRNTYTTVRFGSGNPNIAYKVHLQGPPAPPTAAVASNDVYGQIKLAWTAPAPSQDNPTGYRIYRGAAPDTLALYATTDSYTKWKDSAQGDTAGGPFYYEVRSYNGAGESLGAAAGPISTAASTAPAPLSKGIAFSFSTPSSTDTLNNPGYNGAWQNAKAFLDQRAVAYDIFNDYGPIGDLNIEDDDLAGYKTLILALNRNMSSYTAQCIKDYIKYSQGKVISGYYNSIADHTGFRNTNFSLADVYRTNAFNEGASPFFSSVSSYKFLKQIGAASEAAVLFAGLNGSPYDGAQLWNPLGYLINAYGDGTASEVGEYYNADGVTKTRVDAANIGLTVGYTSASKTTVQSIFAGANWWGQSTAGVQTGGGPGTFSADRLIENILGFMNIPFTPASSYEETIGFAKTKTNFEGTILKNKVITRILTGGTTSPVYIQESDRSSGVKLVGLPPTAIINEGDTISVVGRMETAAGERQVQAYEYSIGTPSTVPAPLYVTLKSLGGQTVGNNAGIANGIGLANIGLLVRVSGTLTELNADDIGLFFRIDDGSGLTYGTAPAKGVKVRGFSPSANLGDYVAATGVLGTELDGADVVPVIRMRDIDFGDLLAP